MPNFFKCKNKYQKTNRILILIFSLLVLYVCTWPFNIENPSHVMDELSVRIYKGQLAHSLEVEHYESDGYTPTVLPEGTEIAYIFNKEGTITFVCTPDDLGSAWPSDSSVYQGIAPHTYTRQEISADDFTSPEAVADNYNDYISNYEKAHDEYLKVSQYYKFRFVPSRLVIGIPVGLAVFILLSLLENKFENSRRFTTIFSIFLAICILGSIPCWIALGALCR